MWSPYTLAPTKQPKYSCKSEVNFHTECEKACGFRNRTEQPFYEQTKINEPAPEPCIVAMPTVTLEPII